MINFFKRSKEILFVYKNKFFPMRRTKALPERRTKSFDVNNIHDKLFLIMIFVKKGHGDATNNLLLENGVSMTTKLYAFGTKTTYAKDIFGGEEKNKEAIFSIIPQSKCQLIHKALEDRFEHYPAAQGVVLVFNIKSFAGVLAYKYLTDYEGALQNGTK